MSTAGDSSDLALADLTVPALPQALLGFCAYGSGIGKTTLLAQLIPELTARGLRISVIKHAHHSFDIDHPGKDSYRLREAGAVQTMIGSSRRWALMTELNRTRQAGADSSLADPKLGDPKLADLVAAMNVSLTDLILVEGFRHEAIAKIEVHRAAVHTPLLAPHDAGIIAVASDDATLQTAQPRLDLNDIAGIADFVVRWLAMQKRPDANASPC